MGQTLKCCSSIPNDRDGRVDITLEDNPNNNVIVNYWFLTAYTGNNAECLSECW